MRLRLVRCLGLIFGIWLLATTTASAASPPTQNLSFGPAILNFRLNAGSSASGTLNVTNNGASGYGYTIYASPYGVQSETYKPLFKSLPGYANIAKWFSFTPDKGYVQPGQMIAVKYTIVVPPGIAPGSYYAAVFAQTKSIASQKVQPEIALTQRIGSLFYVNINGQATEAGSINSWGAGLFQSSPVRADLKLANSGKLYYVSNINVYFKDIFGGTKYHFVDQKIIIPKVVRNIPISWSDPPSIGLFKVNGTVTIYGQKSLGTHYILIMSTAIKIAIVIFMAAIILAYGISNSVGAIRGTGQTKYKIKK